MAEACEFTVDRRRRGRLLVMFIKLESENNFRKNYNQGCKKRIFRKLNPVGFVGFLGKTGFCKKPNLVDFGISMGFHFKNLTTIKYFIIDGTRNGNWIKFGVSF